MQIEKKTKSFLFAKMFFYFTKDKLLPDTETKLNKFPS